MEIGTSQDLEQTELVNWLAGYMDSYTPGLLHTWTLTHLQRVCMVVKVHCDVITRDTPTLIRTHRLDHSAAQWAD